MKNKYCENLYFEIPHNPSIFVLLNSKRKAIKENFADLNKTELESFWFRYRV